MSLNTGLNDADIFGPLTGESGFNLIGMAPWFVRNPSPGTDGIWGTGDDDPGDLRLTTQSPAVNRGNDNAIPAGLTTDLDGQPRVYDGRVDIGAYEYQDTLQPGRETASTIVTTLADTVDLYDGEVSLREAIFYTGVESLTGPITFDALLDEGEVTLEGNSLFLDHSVQIDASLLGSLIINADNKSRVFTIYAGDVELVGLTVTGGSAYDGGGILSYGGTLTVTNSTVSGNSASWDGGGIRSSGTLTITNSTVSGNSADERGGGICNSSGTLTVTNSTISGNSADGGGGIYGTSTVISSTVSGNSANDGGGIYSEWGSPSTVTNSILAGNAAPAAPDISDAMAEGSDYNLIGVWNGDPTAYPFSLLGTQEQPLDARLRPLGDYGGPTKTMPLSFDSPAINAGNNDLAVASGGEPLAFDQRGEGFDRIAHLTVDMGAYEWSVDDPLFILPDALNHLYLNHLSDRIVLEFSQEVDQETFTPEDVLFVGPGGPVPITGVERLSPGEYAIRFDRLPVSGEYQLTVLPDISDINGNLFDQNRDGVGGQPEDAYEHTFVADTVSPRIVAHQPAGDITGTIDHVDIWFTELIDQTTFTTPDVAITDPDGQAIAVTSIEEVGLNRYRIGFVSLTTVGVYRIEIGPIVTDPFDNPLDQDQDGEPGESGDDVYDAAFNFVAVDLQVSNLTVDAAELWAGEPVGISWEVFNSNGTPLVGDWTDGVYLSTDGQWDIGDQLLATVSHGGGLTEDQVDQQSATASVPGVLPGNYYVIVRTDFYNQEKEGGDEGNNVVAVGPLPLNARQLPTDGVPVDGSLNDADRHDYYAIDVSAGEHIFLTLDDADDVGYNEVYVRYDEIPTRSEYDYRHGTNFASDQQIQVPDTLAGTYYVMVYGDSVPDGTSDYAVSAVLLDFSILEIAPDQGSNAGMITIKLDGAHLEESETVELVAGDGASVAAINTDFSNSYDAWAMFDLSGLSSGLYDVRVTRPDGAYAVLDDAFTVLDGSTGGGPKLVSRIVSPEWVRVGDTVTFYVETSNEGTNDSSVPVVWVTMPDGTETLIDLQLDGNPFPVVRPGTTVRVPITFTAPRTPGSGTIGMEVFDVPPESDSFLLFSPADFGIDIKEHDSQHLEGEDASGKYKYRLSPLPSGGPRYVDTPSPLFKNTLEASYPTDWKFDYSTNVSGTPSNANTHFELVGYERNNYEWAGAHLNIDEVVPWIQVAQGFSSTHPQVSNIPFVDPPGSPLPFYWDPYERGATASTARSFLDLPAYQLGGASRKAASASGHVFDFTAQLNTHPADWSPPFNPLAGPENVAVGREGIVWGYNLTVEADPTVSFTGVIEFFGSMDPNEIVGPAGAGEFHHVTPTTTMPYTIFFENDPEVANAPAQEVRITNTLDEDLDLATFELTEIAFADHTISVPAGMAYYETSVDLRPEGIDAIVYVEASLNPETREVTTLFRAIDPDTGWIPEDPRIGLLYPNDDTHRGEGHVSYLIRPNLDLASGVQVTNQAKIFFDRNDPIDTPEVFNTIDAGTPSSQVDPLPAEIDGYSFPVSPAGTDEVGGSGIGYYDVYVSDNGGPFSLWLDDTTDTAAEFTGDDGHTYEFYSVATDLVGHREDAPLTADTETTLHPTILRPVANDDDVTTDEEAGVTFGVLANDTDGQGIPLSDYDTLTIASEVEHGTLTLNADDSFTYVPDQDFSGFDSFTYTVSDALNDSNVAEVLIHVTAVNDGPSITSVSVTPAIDEGQMAELVVEFTDPDDLLDWHIVDIDWGDGTTESQLVPWGEQSFSASHQYMDGPEGAVAEYAISVTIVDSGEEADTSTTSVAVINVAPVLTIGGAATANAGGTFTLELASEDPGDDTITSWAIDWGDGYIETVPGNPPATTHVYSQPDTTYFITATASDEDGTWTAEGSGGVYSEMILADEPAAYWRMNETSGTTAVNLGTSGNSADGTYIGDVTLGAPGAITDHR